MEFMSRAGVTALKIENIEDFYGRPFPTASAPKATRDIFFQQLKRAKVGETNTVEYSFEVDGKVIWYKTTFSPFFDTDGNLIYITADSLVITKTKLIEERNKMLLETSPVCLKEIHFSDELGYTMMFMSSSGQKLLGIENVEKYYGTPYPLPFYPKKAKELISEALDTLVSTGEPTQVECEVHDTEGNSIWFFSTFTVQSRNESGNVLSITGASHNVTERRRHEEALAKSKEEAEQANRAKSEFLSRMSHELRTPLNAILGFGQLIKMDTQGELNLQKGYLDHILRAGSHLLDLVDDVLDISRIESGNFSINEEHINASETVKNLISQIQPMADERRIKIQNFLDQPDELFVKADHKAFIQIIINLLNNAVKYNNEGGSITVNWGDSGDGNLWISISDTGPGIAEEDIEQLFEPFNRLGQEAGEIEGSGIGLSISKLLAELLGGSLSADCNAGKGCCFKLILPKGERDSVSETRNKANSDSSLANLDIKTRGLTVLYIEDNHINLCLVESFFKTKTDFDFLSAMHPKEGIEIARSNQPDLILMDLLLPDMDGVAAANELKKFEETRDIPIIALSADAMPSDVERALESGFVDYLTKPLNFDVFSATIEKIFKS
jgi:signal transduction histidine kinase/ActR/RegA family two-component response regulator